MKVFNSLNAHEREDSSKKFTQPSMTVPDQSMTVREIMDRYARGLDVGGQQNELWEDEDGSDGINPKTLDLVDLQIMKMQNEEKIQRYQNEDKKRKAKKSEETKTQNDLPEGH